MNGKGFAGILLLFFFTYHGSFTTFHLPILHAAYDEMDAGARAKALGGAFTALADDAHALYYNPAGLKRIQRKEFSASYDLIHVGLRDESKISNTFVAYAHPFQQRIGTFGLAWKEFSTRDLYQERVIALGYGRRFSSRVSLGVNLKHLTREFTVTSGQTDDFGFVNSAKTDPVYNDGNRRSNVSADVGLLLEVGKRTSVGMMAEDINEPDMAISKNNRDLRPMLLRTGLAFQERLLNIVGQINVAKSNSGLGRNLFFSGGAERWWLATKFTRADLAARGSISVGSESFSQMALGCSYRFGTIQIDYGFLMPLQGITFGDNKGSHQFTMSYRFGKNIADTDFKSRFNSAKIILRRAAQKVEYYMDESKKVEMELEDIKARSNARVKILLWIRVNEGEKSVKEFLLDQFEEEFNRYLIRKAAGSTLIERVNILTEIVREFSQGEPGSYNFEIAKKDLEIIRSEKMTQETKFNSSWNNYMKLKAWGATVPDRIELLAEITERFAALGLDLTLVYEELQELKLQK